MSREWQKVKNLLIIRLDNLGDVLLMTPAIHSIKETLPNTRITLLASSIGAQVGSLNDDIDDVIVYDAPWASVDQTLPHNPSREQAMIKKIKDRHFDGAIIFTSYHQSSLPGAYLCYLADIPLRHAASIDFPGTLLTTRHHHPDVIVHEVQRACELVAAIGFDSHDRDMRLNLPSDLTDSVRKELINIGIGFEHPLIVIHPGCSCQARTYPWEGYATAADLLISDWQADIIFTGLPSEVELVQNITNKMQYQAWSLAGQTDFQRLAAIIKLADIVITNNTGPMHICSCLKTPVVVLFAKTNPPQQWGPWKVPHRLLNHSVQCTTPCYKFICPTDHACLAKTGPREIAIAVQDVLREAKEGAPELCH